MPRPDSGARTRIVAGAADMLRRRGFTATSVRELAKHSGAPLGSTYHYFPGGKSELATEAVRFADDRTRYALTAQLAAGSRAGLRAFLSGWRQILADSDFQAGCPVLAVSVDSHPDAAAARAAASDAYAHWGRMLVDALTGDGAAADSARRTATLIIAAVEGAVAMCRAERSLRALDDLEPALDAAVAAVLP